MRGLAALAAILSLACGACAAVNGVVERGGRFIEGADRKFKTASHWRHLGESSVELRLGADETGAKGILFTSSELPWLRFYGTEPDSQGLFYLTKLHFLAGNYGGWQEYDADAAGRGRLRLFDESYGAFTLLDTIERGEIRGGKIRRESARLLDTRARDALRARDERIEYLTGWMREYAALSGATFQSQDAFESWWRPKLLPKNALERRAAPRLPEPLAERRAADALEADWYEASTWIYIEYDWKKTMDILRKEYIVTKIK
jgi:hypothetical protein